MMSDSILSRDQVKPEDKWCLEDLYATDDAFRESYEKMENLLPSFSTYAQKLTTDSVILLDFLKAQEIGNISCLQRRN